METKSEKFQALFTKREKEALRRLAGHNGTSMNSALRAALRTAAKRKKVW